MSFFHYTDANATLSIIQNNELWLTDIRFMNDSEESLDGAKYLMSAISALLLESDANSNRALERLQEFDEQYVKDGLLDDQVFICSFSKTADHLVQWRSYGSYAIEFHDSLKEELKDFYPCYYDEHVKSGEASSFVNKTRQAITSAYQAGEMHWSNAVMEHMWKLADYVHQFKHRSFSDENEVRLIRLMNSLSDNINYRVRGNLVIPYLSVKFDFDHVKAIHVGPMKDQDLAVTSMKSFIHNLEMRRRKVGDYGSYKIQVIPSLIPYRQL